MRYLLDSYAWVEYLNGGDKGIKVREILTGENEIYTLTLNVAEVVSSVKRKGGDADIAYRAITMNSKILDINPEIAKAAGVFHAEIHKKIRNFGLVDSIILTFAKKLNAKILTGDKHFEDFREARML